MKKIGSSFRNPKALQAAPELIEIQAYMPMDPADLERLKADIKENGVRDSLKIYRDRRTGQDLIMGGYNRQQIALELGIDTLPVDEYEGTPQERRELVINDNLNRRHLTAKQKRNLIRYFLKKDPGQSDRIIGKKTGTHHSTVSKERAGAVRRGEISHVDKRTDTRGRQQPAAKAQKTKLRRGNTVSPTHQSKPEPRLAGPRKVLLEGLIQEYIQAQDDPKKAKTELKRFIDSL